MTTLKISDLSVGDWVGMDLAELNMPSDDLATAYIEKPRKPIRIKGISEDSEMVLADIEKIDGRGSIMLKCEYLKPIPITAEILEKNGFTRRSSEFPIYECTTLLGKMLRTTVVSLNHPYSYIVCRIEDTSKELHEFDRIPVNTSVERSQIHIHDLQHALRLAGLDKEINL